uniref:S100P-binding protein n=1 Tax=Seriola lalandi dorsalis TaxID=1841481 RepID=A0A3B4YG45_SERLL
MSLLPPSFTDISIQLNPSECEHLKPLSVYSKMITGDQKASLDEPRKFSNPFINFKIEVVNNCVKKRKLEHSSPDDGYESPAKRSFSPEALSPDLGCFVDDYSPPGRPDSGISASIEKTDALRSEIKETVNSKLCSEHVGCGTSTEPRAMLWEQHNSFPESDLSPIVSGPLESVNSDSLDGDVDDMWNIGPPIFESSLCHSVAVKLNADSEKSRQVTEEVRADVMEPIDVCHTTHGGEEATLDSSYETTLPLQVRVSCLSCTASSGTDDVVLPTCNVMSELLNLMTHVADQSANLRERQWQHPSDLTKRNYQRRWGNITPTISLDEWQAKNCTAHKRFAQVPKIFERSPFP